MTPATIATNRFGLGARPGDSVGADPRGWLAGQLTRDPLRPAASPTRAAAAAMATYRDAIRDIRRAARKQGQDPKTAPGQREVHDTYIHTIRELYVTGVGARLNAALATDTPFVERLVVFWSNHFTVAARKPDVRGLAWGFEAEAIRPHVLGRFRDLLRAAEQHPAMLIYLDAVNSIGPDSPAARNGTRARGLNENLAREILELHTLGVRTGYSQADVTEFARALTGWTAPRIVANGGDGTPGAFGFAADRHQPGDRTIMGRTYHDDGRAQGEAVLDMLAAHPATARHLATKLTRHFAGAPEPPAMVDRLAAAYLGSDGDLPAVYRALIASPEAWVGRPVRFRTPWDWAVAVLRASGVRTLEPAAAVAMFNQLGQPTWLAVQPSGWDDDDATWAAPDALMRRVEEAERLSTRLARPVDARALAAQLFPGAVSPATADALARADSPGQALALLACSPEMMRR